MLKKPDRLSSPRRWLKVVPPAVMAAVCVLEFVSVGFTQTPAASNAPIDDDVVGSIVDAAAAAPPTSRPVRVARNGAAAASPTTRTSFGVSNDPEAVALRKAYSAAPEEWPAADWDPSVAPEKRIELGKVPKPVFPENNPYTAEKAALGRKLFWEPRMSGSAFVACVSCHHPDIGWTDGKTVSQGHQLTPLDRNAPTIMGAQFQKKLMWDGRADSLEDQALLPLANSKEMHGDFTDVEKTLNEIPEYVTEFKSVFGTDHITLEQVQQALATFERTIVPGRSRFDFFLAGRTNSLSDSEIRGLHLFRTKARCINCHSGPLMTDGEFHNLGLTFYKRKFEDLGRYNETKKPEDVGAFRTPTLRNISRTGPYMHNGLFELDGVIALYNAGMPTEKAPPGDPLAPKKSVILKRLALTPQERSDLIEFLRDALEEPRLRFRTPALPGLYGVDPATIPSSTTQPAQLSRTASPTTEPAEDEPAAAIAP